MGYTKFVILSEAKDLWAPREWFLAHRVWTAPFQPGRSGTGQ